MLSNRIKNLRTISTETAPYISTERAELVTEFYKENSSSNFPPAIMRAKNFYNIMANKSVYIGNDELIVGERGPAPRAVPTYPEICCHNIDDLEALHSRKKNPFKIDDQVRNAYVKKIMPYWYEQGKTMREKLFSSMTPKWNEAFNAGVFTEFMEQRSPGHAICGDNIYKQGILDFKKQIEQERAKLSPKNNSDDFEKDIELQAIDIAADAIILYANRCAEKALDLAVNEKDSNRKAELEIIAKICKHVPANAPRTFHEALQMYWFMHLGVITETNPWDSFNPGRLDKNLYPFYQKDIDGGTITEQDARELLQCFWVKFNNHPAPPKVGVTLEQSSTYTDFSLINVGGLDQNGNDCVNKLSYMVLDTIKEMKMTQPSGCIQLSHKNPDSFLRHACEVIKIGIGQPSCFNTDTIIKEMLHDGKTLEDAYNGGASGCVETSAFGKESCTLTGYMNWPKVLEITLNNGLDPNTGVEVGLKTGNPEDFSSFDELMDAYEKQMKYLIDIKIEGNNTIEQLYAKEYPVPFKSLLVEDCIKNGRDYHNGGARYNTTYIQGVGLGITTDCLSAINKHVFQDKKYSMEQLLSALKSDFENDEIMRQVLINKTPCFGNDNPEADKITKAIFDYYFNAIDGRPNTKGGSNRINLLPTTCHIYFGEVTGALPNGRKAGIPLSDGISPTQGADRKGPTAVIKSASKIDHSVTGGTLLNMKFSPQMFQEGNVENLMALIRTYFKMGGHHIQFNIIDAETLRDAQKHPEKHRDLIVRVAGYSDYFVGLGEGLQNEIINRTEQQTF